MKNTIILIIITVFFASCSSDNDNPKEFPGSQTWTRSIVIEDTYISLGLVAAGDINDGYTKDNSFTIDYARIGSYYLDEDQYEVFYDGYSYGININIDEKYIGHTLEMKYTSSWISLYYK